MNWDDYGANSAKGAKIGYFDFGYGLVLHKLYLVIGTNQHP